MDPSEYELQMQVDGKASSDELDYNENSDDRNFLAPEGSVEPELCEVEGKREADLSDGPLPLRRRTSYTSYAPMRRLRRNPLSSASTDPYFGPNAVSPASPVSPVSPAFSQSSSLSGLSSAPSSPASIPFPSGPDNESYEEWRERLVHATPDQIKQLIDDLFEEWGGEDKFALKDDVSRAVDSGQSVVTLF